jgi:glucose/mannose transport system permease protein
MTITRLSTYLCLVIAAAFFLVPVLVMVSTSLKTLDEIRVGDMLSMPVSATVEPWVRAWSSACVGLDCGGLRGFFLNTVLMVVPAVTIITFVGAVNGYVLTQWTFRGHQLVFGLILFGCFIPFQSVIIPMARVLGLLGIQNSIPGLVLVHVVYGLGFSTLFFRNYYANFPRELVRAAQVDGAGILRIFFRIVLPTSGPITIVCVIFLFTNIWNDFLFGATFTSGDKVPVMVALNNIVNTSTGVREYNVHMAAAMIAALPTLIVYIVSGRYFVSGLMAGSVKG